MATIAPAVSPRSPSGPAARLVELITPRTNATPISAVARALAASTTAVPFSLEIAGTAQGRHFLLRAGAAGLGHVERQLGAAYPQAEWRAAGVATSSGPDPARLDERERLATCALVLRAPPYLPLRTFRDPEVAAERAPQADPVLGILGAMAGLPEGWRALSQLLLFPAPADWARPYQRLALERPLEAERGMSPAGGPSGGSIAAVAGLVLLLLAAPAGQQWYEAGDWAHLGLLGLGMAGGVPAALALKAHLTTSAPHDPALVREKLAHPAFRAQLRLSVVAPSDVALAEQLARLDQLVAAYGQYCLPTGNGLRGRAIALLPADLAALRACPARRRGILGRLPARAATALLTAHELAGLWHLPPAQADVPHLERTTARRWAPPPDAVAGGCRIGVSSDQGGLIPVALPPELQHRHMLLVAKTRRGKSSLLLRLAKHAMDDGSAPALMLVDPHGDLAREALGLVPAHRRDDVVYLDAAERQRPFGLNLLDAGLGWDADRAVASALSIFKHQWDQFWGPRMEDVFRMVLHTLFAANAARCRADPAEREHQYTILEIPALLFDLPFRKAVLAEARDPIVTEWWQVHFEGLLDRKLRLESANPVLSKVNRIAASAASRLLLGQGASSIDPADWLREGRLVIVHTAQGTIGEDTAALIGGSLLNLVKLEVRAQAAAPPAQRRPMRVIVDEFHTMPGADYEAFLGELAKFGAALTLATQTIARLDTLDRAHDRGLRATLFSNLDGLFAFHCSAEDARFLVPELGGEVDVPDLVSLGEHRCYARISAGRERLPAFSVRLDPPPAGDAGRAEQLAAGSARLYGRPREAVEAARAAMRERVLTSHLTVPGQSPARPGAAVLSGPAPWDAPSKGPRPDGGGDADLAYSSAALAADAPASGAGEETAP